MHTALIETGCIVFCHQKQSGSRIAAAHLAASCAGGLHKRCIERQERTTVLAARTGMILDVAC